ncbi:DUF4198 domain-containing protein [Pseudomonas sp. MM211]|uniref:DUF4198 domain-containing protein n=1 Tax=Pseudomonas sp. MM211 TaxID=2866808 RepID=UPI001CECE5A3|nr:DUF4198 domain-containing protein [Pseudomonas sp. MM211]UCJ16860.1 DUF4198 domain-containing protein [Pseudomonas sp. MM211]
MRISSKTAALLALLAVAGQAGAHGLWTEQRRGNIEVVYGHGAEDDAFKADKISRAWAFNGAGKTIPVTIERLADHARLKPLSVPASLAVALDNGAWSKTADGKWINQGRSKVPNAVEALHTYKYSLAIYQEGAQLPDLKDLRMVIVPLADPLEVGVGKPLPVRVLVDGKPAADIKLIGDYRSAPDQVSATTNAKGEAQVVIRNEGLNIIAAEASQAVKGDADIDSRGYFTSLTFIGQGHHH